MFNNEFSPSTAATRASIIIPPPNTQTPPPNAPIPRKMEQHSQQDPLSTGGAQSGEVHVDEPLWYARSCTCGTIIEVLSALDVATTKGGVGPQAAVEISEEAGMQIRVLEGAHSTSTRPSWHLARHRGRATLPRHSPTPQATHALGSARGRAQHRGVGPPGPLSSILHGQQPCRRHAARLCIAQAVPFRGLDLHLCRAGSPRPLTPRPLSRARSRSGRPNPVAHAPILPRSQSRPDMHVGRAAGILHRPRSASGLPANLLGRGLTFSAALAPSRLPIPPLAVPLPPLGVLLDVLTP